jgi:quinol monooxygenase YgiN
MLHASIRMMMPAEKRGEAIDILLQLVQHARSEPGCISCYLYQDVQEKRALMLEQSWSSQEDLLRHLRSAEYREVLIVVEMASEQPEIRFDTIARSSGVETIEKARLS